LGALLTLDTLTDETGNATGQLTAQTRAWFKAARFDVATVADVIDSLENGLKHVIQVAKYDCVILFHLSALAKMYVRL
jgi:hypothetical protein